MVKKWIFPLLIGVCLINTSMAQENPILLFPKGAPGETIKLIEKADTDGGKTGGESVLRITNVSEPTITIYHADIRLQVFTNPLYFNWELRPLKAPNIFIPVRRLARSASRRVRSSNSMTKFRAIMKIKLPIKAAMTKNMRLPLSLNNG